MIDNNNTTAGNTLLPLDMIVNGDCISNMRNLPDSCVDLIIADPRTIYQKAEIGNGTTVRY